MITEKGINQDKLTESKHQASLKDPFMDDSEEECSNDQSDEERDAGDISGYSKVQKQTGSISPISDGQFSSLEGGFFGKKNPKSQS
jgi:hypothetical protein